MSYSERLFPPAYPHPGYEEFAGTVLDAGYADLAHYLREQHCDQNQVAMYDALMSFNVHIPTQRKTSYAQVFQQVSNSDQTLKELRQRPYYHPAVYKGAQRARAAGRVPKRRRARRETIITSRGAGSDSPRFDINGAGNCVDVRPAENRQDDIRLDVPRGLVYGD